MAEDDREVEILRLKLKIMEMENASAAAKEETGPAVGYLEKPRKTGRLQFLHPKTYQSDCVHSKLHPVDCIGAQGEPYLLELEAEPSYNYGLLNKKGFLAELYRHTESAKVYHELQQLASADLLEQLVQTRAAVQGLKNTFKELCPPPEAPQGEGDEPPSAEALEHFRERENAQFRAYKAYGVLLEELAEDLSRAGRLVNTGKSVQDIIVHADSMLMADLAPEHLVPAALKQNFKAQALAVGTSTFSDPHFAAQVAQFHADTRVQLAKNAAKRMGHNGDGGPRLPRPRKEDNQHPKHNPSSNKKEQNNQPEKK